MNDTEHRAAAGGAPPPAGTAPEAWFTIDLHLHTSRGSSDSNLTPVELIERAAAAGLGAIAVTEHDHVWDLAELRALGAAAGVTVLGGMEVTTETGHIGVFGLDRYVSGIYKLKQLRKVADDCGAILIANHPFRYRLDPRVSFMNQHQEAVDGADIAAAAAPQWFGLVDAIEVLNGACSEEENLFALQVARALKLAEVAGSDSHSAQSVGCVCTLLERPARSERELIDSIRARRARAGRGLLEKRVAAFEPPPR